jgi:DNA-binding transcriptional MerR regulator
MPAETSALFSLGVAADLTGVHPDMLRYYCRIGLLGVDRTGMLHEPTFDEDALQEVRRIEHYRRHLAVSRQALPLVCELRREAERRHIEIHFLRCPEPITRGEADLPLPSSMKDEAHSSPDSR